MNRTLGCPNAKYVVPAEVQAPPPVVHWSCNHFIYESPCRQVLLNFPQDHHRDPSLRLFPSSAYSALKPHGLCPKTPAERWLDQVQSAHLALSSKTKCPLLDLDRRTKGEHLLIIFAPPNPTILPPGQVQSSPEGGLWGSQGAECARGLTGRYLALGPIVSGWVLVRVGRQMVPNDLRPCIRAGRQPHKRGSYATQTQTKTKGWKPPKVGGRPPVA